MPLCVLRALPIVLCVGLRARAAVRAHHHVKLLRFLSRGWMQLWIDCPHTQHNAPSRDCLLWLWRMLRLARCGCTVCIVYKTRAR